jgi:para-aminobenzoate synthetase component 1
MSMQSITTWTFEPGEPLNIARRFADLEGTVLLYSGGCLEASKESFLCLLPEKKIIVQAEACCWETLKCRLGSFDPHASFLPYWVGYLGYELGGYADFDKKIDLPYSALPDACFYAPTAIVHFAHRTRQATLFSKYGPISLNRCSGHAHEASKFSLGYCSDTEHTYREKIAQAKKWILDGEIYQVNLSHAMHLQGKCTSFFLFEQVAHLNPAPFMAYLNCGSFSVVSSSPERFLCKKGSWLETRPIKGTAPRGKNAEEDVLNRTALLTSEKERSELLMITDLMRNDLGQVSLPGSVQVQKMWACEAYQNVFHLLSIIEGKVEASQHPVDIVRPLFPGGSITGCPKLRAMAAIAQLENRARGIYTGSLGYFSENGDFDFNIAIRTLIVHAEHIELQLGGAIVIDSDPKMEFEETLHKGRSLFSILDLKEYL